MQITPPPTSARARRRSPIEAHGGLTPGCVPSPVSKCVQDLFVGTDRFEHCWNFFNTCEGLPWNTSQHLSPRYKASTEHLPSFDQKNGSSLHGSGNTVIVIYLNPIGFLMVFAKCSRQHETSAREAAPPGRSVHPPDPPRPRTRRRFHFGLHSIHRSPRSSGGPFWVRPLGAVAAPVAPLVWNGPPTPGGLCGPHLPSYERAPSQVVHFHLPPTPSTRTVSAPPKPSPLPSPALSALRSPLSAPRCRRHRGADASGSPEGGGGARLGPGVGRVRVGQRRPVGTDGCGGDGIG